MKKNPFGKKGDFITAPNISSLYSEMIAIWIISLWQSLGSPKKFNLIELGAGNGQMMKVFIESFQRFPIFLKSFDPHRKLCFRNCHPMYFSTRSWVFSSSLLPYFLNLHKL